MKFIERRAWKRIPVNQDILISLQGSTCPGTLVNCSECGMYIATSMIREQDLAGERDFKIHIPFRNEKVNVSARAVRLADPDCLFQGIGIEILTVPQKYLEFLVRLTLSRYV